MGQHSNYHQRYLERCDFWYLYSDYNYFLRSDEIVLVVDKKYAQPSDHSASFCFSLIAFLSLFHYFCSLEIASDEKTFPYRRLCVDIQILLRIPEQTYA